MQVTLFARFEHMVDLPASCAESRIAKHFDIEPRQVKCRYLNRKMPSDPGEKLLEIVITGHEISNEEILVALGLMDNFFIDDSARKETIMPTEEKDKKTTELLDMDGGGSPSTSETTLIETFKKIFFNDVINWAKQQIIKSLEKVQDLVKNYEIKVAEQDKKLSALQDAINESEKNAISIKATDETRNKKLAERISLLEIRLNNAAIAAENQAKALKGQ